MIQVLCKRCKNSQLISDKWGQFWCITCKKELKLYQVIFATDTKNDCPDCHGYGAVTAKQQKKITELTVDERIVMKLEDCPTCEGTGKMS